jgi:hypothetical protein
MNFLRRLERSLGWLTIGHLPIYIVTAQAIVYVWIMMNPDGVHLLTLDPLAIKYNHEYWRLLTFLFMVPFQNPLWAFLYLYFQYVCGSALEEEWGSFPVTMFYLVGALGAMAGGFIVGFDINSAFFFSESIFLAFAALFPNFQILLFFILPVKVKWIAWFTWIRIIYSIYDSPPLLQLAIVASLSHYFLFFGRTHFEQVKSLISRWRHRQRYKDFVN